MATTSPTTLTAFAVGATLCGLGAWGTGAQAAPRVHGVFKAAVHTAHRLVPTPPDSYLQYKVYTVDQLIQQVADNPTVRDRFARHFQISPNHIVDYMRKNLVESYVPKTGRYTVYCVRRSGKFYPVRQTFHQGTKVFALRNGEPLMKWVCGNPLTRFASTVTDVVSPKPILQPMVSEFIPSDLESQVVPSEKPVVLVSPFIGSLSSPVSTAITHRGGSLAAFGFLPALGLLGLNHGHSTSPRVIVIPEVPESNGLLYLAVGLPVAVFAVRRRRSVKTDA